MKLKTLAARLGCVLRGDGDVEIDAIRSLEDAGPGHLTFLANPKYQAQLASTRASAVLLATDHAELVLPTLRADNPYVAFAEALTLLHEPRPLPAGVHPRAVIAGSARIGDGASIGANVVIGDDVVIGPRAVLHPNVTIYPGVHIGSDCVAHAGVVVREDVRLGDRVMLHPGVVIGADGFGFAPGPRGAVKIPQIGTVIIEDDVEIGANATVDRATLGATIVRTQAKLDNLVMVAHNCEIGAGTMLAAQVGVAGSTKVGRGVQMGGQAGVAGHITIGDGVQVVAQSGIPSSVEAGKIVGGYPAVDVSIWRRTSAALLRLPGLLRRVRRLERRIDGALGSPDGE